MADEVDLAQIQVEGALKALLKARKPEGPEATGECLYCQEPLAEGRRWCDAECRDAWQYDQKWR
jgi:hypothetical protein